MDALTEVGGTPLEHPPYSPDLAPCDFWAFQTVKREIRGKKFRSDQRSAAHFREVGGAL
jgi:histone-lysine N-methyltransferase SETMAR